MILFNKEKDLILRILNLGLVIAILISLTVLFNGIVNLLVKEPKLTESQYEIRNCIKIEDELCKNNYKVYLEEKSNNDIRYKKQILSTILISLTVVGTIAMVNKK